MKLSADNLKILIVDESCRLKAYQDTGGVWTIGFGHTKGVKPGDVIMLPKAYELLSQDMGDVERWINVQGLKLNQNQFDSLCDFIYNCGPGNFIKWGLLNMIRKNPMNKEIGDEIMKHCHDAHGTELPGLVRRRERNVDLYFKSI